MKLIEKDEDNSTNACIVNLVNGLPYGDAQPDYFEDNVLNTPYPVDDDGNMNFNKSEGLRIYCAKGFDSPRGIDDLTITVHCQNHTKFSYRTQTGSKTQIQILELIGITCKTEFSDDTSKLLDILTKIAKSAKENSNDEKNNLNLLKKPILKSINEFKNKNGLKIFETPGEISGTRWNIISIVNSPNSFNGNSLDWIMFGNHKFETIKCLLI